MNNHSESLEIIIRNGKCYIKKHGSYEAIKIEKLT